jgi:hypothetical protein
MKNVIVAIPLPAIDRTVRVSAGGSAYFRIDRKFDSVVFSGGTATAVYVNDFHPVSNKVGREEIRQTRLSVQ